MSAPNLTITEHDEAGNLLTTYIATNPNNPFVKHDGPTPGTSSRVDIIRPQNAKALWQQCIDIFLPAGYPHSVTDDYLEYQIYDSLQAFSSSIAGLLSSRAVLEGVGVGDATASPTLALLYSVLQDSTGRLATIAFAWRLGTSLEPECKAYRLAADIFNDAAMILDLMSPIFPKPARVVILSVASVGRALCGVAAGSAKASLSAHFAKQGNLGELNAKDSSQETVISLVGMLVGTFVVSHVTSKSATWFTLLFLLSIHLGTNYLAVRAVRLRSLNRQRANIVFSEWLEKGVILSPSAVSQREKVFERNGVLRSRDGKVLGTAQVGVSMGDVFRRMGKTKGGSGSIEMPAGRSNDVVPALLARHGMEEFIFYWDHSSREALIVLKSGCTPQAQLKAWLLALMVAGTADRGRMWAFKGGLVDVGQISLPVSEEQLKGLEALEMLNEKGKWEGLVKGLKEKGWDLSVAALEVKSGVRVKADA